ncbi:MAG TPA: ABC transporter permease, partial [Acidimicrobiales bacterium]|nr:ABC transporter permease [Acidimicrobiales bacterium]
MRFVIRRLGFFLLTLWAAVTINFVVPRLMPGNPALAMMAQYHGRVSGQALKALEVAFGVDSHQNVFISYFQYLGNCLTFNFGESFTNGFQPVSQAVMNALP